MLPSSILADASSEFPQALPSFQWNSEDRETESSSRQEGEPQLLLLENGGSNFSITDVEY